MLLKALLFFIFGLTLEADDFLSGFMSGGGQEEEFYEDEFSEDSFQEDSPRWQVENAIDLLERNRGINLTAEQFIYPFDVQHSPMLSSNLVPSVQGGSDGFRNTTVKKLEDPKNKLKVKKKPVMRRNPGDALAALARKDSSSIRKKSTKDKKKPKKEVKLPGFEISGKFGTLNEQYIVIGNRYYSVDEKLKGTRDLRRVRLIGIDEHNAYFRYQKTVFPKKINALKRIF